MHLLFTFCCLLIFTEYKHLLLHCLWQRHGIKEAETCVKKSYCFLWSRTLNGHVVETCTIEKLDLPRNCVCVCVISIFFFFALIFSSSPLYLVGQQGAIYFPVFLPSTWRFQRSGRILATASLASCNSRTLFQKIFTSDIYMYFIFMYLLYIIFFFAKMFAEHVKTPWRWH